MEMVQASFQHGKASDLEVLLLYGRPPCCEMDTCNTLLPRLS